MKKPVNIFTALRHPARLLQDKSFVLIVSAQRSGSTLLKALLATAPDVSHLPEVPFHLYGDKSAWQLKSLSDKPIIVLKKPSWPNELNYPKIPPLGAHKLLILIRHPYETILSTGKMYEALDSDFWQKWDYEKMLYDYWLPTYERILERQLPAQANAKIVRYESLTESPIKQTASLFSFIGSKKQLGTDTYQPATQEWAFMKDDGSENIKSLKVIARPIRRENKKLLEMINQEKRVAAVLSAFGYPL